VLLLCEVPVLIRTKGKGLKRFKTKLTNRNKRFGYTPYTTEKEGVEFYEKLEKKCKVQQRYAYKSKKRSKPVLRQKYSRRKERQSGYAQPVQNAKQQGFGEAETNQKRVLLGLSCMRYSTEMKGSAKPDRLKSKRTGTSMQGSVKPN
jgi:hypothetical protein